MDEVKRYNELRAMAAIGLISWEQLACSQEARDLEHALRRREKAIRRWSRDRQGRWV